MEYKGQGKLTRPLERFLIIQARWNQYPLDIEKVFLSRDNCALFLFQVAYSLLSEACDNGSIVETCSLESLSWAGDKDRQIKKVKEAVAAAVLQIRENIFPSRGVRLSVPDGVVAGYYNMCFLDREIKQAQYFIFITSYVHNVQRTKIADVKMGTIGVVPVYWIRVN